jgi:proteasome lid subunit RPN8/RPN11
MTLWLAAPVVAAIHAHAGRAYPEECCGALIGTIVCPDGADRRATGAVALENEAAGPRAHRFLISSSRYLACERLGARLGLDVVGFYHSHPDAEPVPSAVDRAFGWPWYCYVITAAGPGGAGPLRAWMLRDDRAGYLELALSIMEPAS